MDFNDAAQAAMRLAGAISEGINCVGYLQTLRSAPPIVTATDRDAWCETLANLHIALETVRAGQASGQVQTVQPIGDDLPRAIADLRADLAAASPGARLPASTLDRADAAYDAIRINMMGVRERKLPRAASP
jgi:hypothetical protein